MARLVLALLTLCVVAVAHGQFFSPNQPPTATIHPVTYTGPGDITSFTAWYSCTRGYSAAVAATGTQKACDLRRASDNATCTVLVGTNGKVDYTAGTPCGGQTVTAWIGASSAFVSKAYDQTNRNACMSTTTCDMVQTSSGSQPSLVLTGCGVPGTLPCISAAASQQLASANTFAPASGNVSLSVLANSSNANAETFVGESAANSVRSGLSTNQWLLNGHADFLAVVASDGVWHAGNGVIASGTNNSIMNIDGTETSGTLTLYTGTANPIFSQGGAEYVAEGGFIDNTVWTQTIRAKLCANQAAYYGTTVGTHCS